MTLPATSQLSTETLTLATPAEVVVDRRKSAGMFVLTEFLVYSSQIVMFFFVAVILSNLLRDEKYLLDYMTSKINENTVFEVVAMMLAVAATMGIITAISKAAPPSSLLEQLADEVLSEAPRTAYVFGSSVAGTLLAAAMFMQNHPKTEGPRPQFWLLAAAFAAFVGFAYGCMLAYAFKHKTQIK